MGSRVRIRLFHIFHFVMHFLFPLLKNCKGEFPVMAETTRNHIFSKEISQVIIAAMVLAPISIEKIVCEWFQLWEEIRLKSGVNDRGHRLRSGSPVTNLPGAAARIYVFHRAGLSSIFFWVQFLLLLHMVTRSSARLPTTVPWVLAEFYFNRGLQRLYTGTCIILQKTINRFLCLVIVFLKVQMKCFFLFPNLKEQQKSGRSPFTVS